MRRRGRWTAIESQRYNCQWGFELAVSLQRRKRAGGWRYTATVRRAGVTISASFWQRRQAESWGRQCESAVDAASLARIPFDRVEWIRRGRDPGDPVTLAQLDLDRAPDTSTHPRPDWTLRRALEHYEQTVTPKKKGDRQERARLAAWRDRDIADTRLDRVNAADLQRHVDARLASGRAAQTVRNETLTLSAVYRHAVEAPRPGGGAGGGWGLHGLLNPVAAVHLPSAPQGRQRRLQDAEDGTASEEDRLRAAFAIRKTHGVLLDAVLTLAVETGLRLSELLALRTSQLRRARGARWVEQADSKNGSPRRVVLSSRAGAAVDTLAAARGTAAADARLIPVTEHALRWAWRRSCEKAGVIGLTLHDLRHEALSRQAGAGLTIGELQQQSGHKTAQILLRYVNARAADVSKKLG